MVFILFLFLLINIIPLKGRELCKPSSKFLSKNLKLQSVTLKEGDIIFADVHPIFLNLCPYIHRSGYVNDHVLIYWGKIGMVHYFIESSNYSIFGLIDYLDGIQFKPRWFVNLVFTNLTCGKIDNIT